MSALWIDRLRRFLGDTPVLAPERPVLASNDGQTHDLSLDRTPIAEAQVYLKRVRHKMEKLVQDFVQGQVNRLQFEELYAHYQEERNTIQNLITSHPQSGAWRMAVTEGESLMIRRRNAARALNYAVYNNTSREAIRLYGELSPYNRAKILSVLNGVSESNVEPGKAEAICLGIGEEGEWLCYVNGEYSTLIVFFNREPARVQLELLEDLHAHFEQANGRILSRPRYNISDLVFPYAAAFE